MSRNWTRRSLLAFAPTVATLVISEAGIVTEAAAQPPRDDGPLRISKDQLKAALDVLGLDFTEAQRDMMLPDVNRALTGYERLRKINIPLDTEPAFHFRPALPGKEPKSRAAKFFPSHSGKFAAFKDPEDLAFLPVTELAPLIRTKKISSTDLTKMYLARLKKYSPKLLNVVTLTEDLALEQAGDADKEIKSGKYRGPLHGIPFGAKDLFNTKGILTTWGAEPFKDQVPTYNATCIDRLYKAGAVLVAKLSMGALGARRRVVRRDHQKSMEHRARFQRILGGLRLGHRRGHGRILHRHRNPGLHRQPELALRSYRSASDLWPRQPLRSHGPQLDHGQDRTHLPVRGGLRARA